MQEDSPVGDKTTNKQKHGDEFDGIQDRWTKQVRAPLFSM
jgi:hypothetical protein